MQKIRTAPSAFIAATDLREASLRTRFTITAAGVFIYVPAFLLLYAKVGPVAASLSILPGLLAGWTLGRRGGLLVAVTLTAMHWATLLLQGDAITAASVTGASALFIVVLGSSVARGAYLRLRERAEAADDQREEMQRVTRELRRSYEALDAVLETAPLQMAQIDARGVITAFRGSSLIGVDVAPADLVGRSLLELRADHPDIPNMLRRALLGEEVAETVQIGERFEHIRMTPVLGQDGRVRRLNTVSLDVTERERALEDARRMASIDPLTDLPNRVLFMQRGTAAAEVDPSLSVLAIDIDGFRELNAALGHEAGDDVLRIVGKRLTSAVDADDTVARFAGNAFAILLPGARSEHVGAIAARIQELFARPIEIGGNAIEVGASIGSACAPEDGATFDAVLHHAEIAMHEAKRARSGHFAYTAQLAGADRERVTLLADLRRAIQDDDLELEYQPIVSLEDRRPMGVEALLRWRHPVRGDVAPASFIPFVERSLLGRELSRWVARRMWHDTRTMAVIAGPLSFAVNLSARDLGSAEVMSEIKGLRKRVGDSGRVVVEITESDVMADPERAIAALTALRATGVKIALDDFGTGYSSLAYLHRLPLDFLKIDKSFVARMADDARAREVVRATITIAHALGLKVVGEGCEDERSLEMLRDLGCDRAQGWGIARAMSVERLAAWLFEQARAPLPRPALVLEPYLGHDLVTAAAE